MSVNTVKNRCYGCTVCYNICPQNAIELVKDEQGFIVPKVDQKLCNECSLCEKNCMVYTDNLKLNEVCSVFAAKSKSEKIHLTSQSGGVAYEISEKFLNKINHSIVFGAAFNEKMEVRHIDIENQNNLYLLQGSKYVQSYLGSVFKKVEQNLKKDKKVLFIGTPCQVYGLKQYCMIKQSNMDNLFTCDLVCYGVSSPGVFKDWIKMLEEGKKSNLKEMYFRDPSDKWGNGREKYVFVKGEILKTKVYMNWYFANFITRTSCETCKFSNIKRAGDITLGDFWGINECMPDFADKQGISLVLINSEKGKYIWELLENDLKYRKSNIESAQKAQTRLEENEKKIDIVNKKRFWKIYNKYGIRYLAEENGIFEPRISIKIRWKLSILKNKIMEKLT